MVSRIEEHKTDVYPHFYVIIENIPSTFYVEPFSYAYASFLPSSSGISGKYSSNSLSFRLS